MNNEDDTWYNDYSSKTYTNARYIVDDIYLLSGQLRNIEWKLSPTETREIAGFNCRKATGIIYDSVYVFAFYTDEVTTAGGPMGINGLPGMIMGLTIPRMYASWIATKLQLAADTKKIIAPVKGKKKDPVELKTSVQKLNNNYLTDGQQTLWHYFL
jgi:GLPGLI family protein